MAQITTTGTRRACSEIMSLFFDLSILSLTQSRKEQRWTTLFCRNGDLFSQALCNAAFWGALLAFLVTIILLFLQVDPIWIFLFRVNTCLNLSVLIGVWRLKWWTPITAIVLHLYNLVGLFGINSGESSHASAFGLIVNIWCIYWFVKNEKYFV